MPTPAMSRAVLVPLLLAAAACGGPMGGNGQVASPAPQITALDVRGAPPAGGTAVVITGKGFQAGLDVTFGGVAATAVSVDPAGEVVRCVTPSHPAGACDVVVTNPDGQSATLSGFAYEPPPVAESFFPGSAAPGATFTVLGVGLVPGMSGGAEVTVGGVQATIVSSVLLGRAADSPIEDTAIVPSLPPGSYEVDVVNPDGQRGVCPGLLVVTGP